MVEQEHGDPLERVPVHEQGPAAPVDHLGRQQAQLPDGALGLVHGLGGHLLNPDGFAVVRLGGDRAGLDLNHRATTAGRQQAVALLAHS
ncbi:hypothetical protein [Streptomyces sp. NPDC090445]|uniref:hypothetical protein n=1 Tax=Streptomyces sp. NPDC090445 TaxID=3365963 RepID=UPI00381B32BA